MLDTTVSLLAEEAALLVPLLELRAHYFAAADDPETPDDRSDYLTLVGGELTNLIAAVLLEGEAFTETIIELQFCHFGMGGGRFDSPQGREAVAAARDYVPALDEALRLVSL